MLAGEALEQALAHQVGCGRGRSRRSRSGPSGRRSAAVRRPSPGGRRRGGRARRGVASGSPAPRAGAHGPVARAGGGRRGRCSHRPRRLPRQPERQQLVDDHVVVALGRLRGAAVGHLGGAGEGVEQDPVLGQQEGHLQVPVDPVLDQPAEHRRVGRERRLGQAPQDAVGGRRAGELERREMSTTSRQPSRSAVSTRRSKAAGERVSKSASTATARPGFRASISRQVRSVRRTPSTTRGPPPAAEPPVAPRCARWAGRRRAISGSITASSGR